MVFVAKGQFIDRHYSEIMKEHEVERTAEPEMESHAGKELQLHAPENDYVPDPTITIKMMHAYGYTDNDMLPLFRERALELFERGVTVYMLYDDNSEAMAFESEDIQLFSGFFGVSREDWEQVRGEIPPMDAEMIRWKREQAFLESSADAFAIYQLKRNDATTDLRFMGMEHLKKKGVEPQRDNYDLVYTGVLTSEGTQLDKLEGIYRTFNIDHPADFTGHSLSVSDIVALKQDGVVTYHYVDSIGYKELLNFLEPVHNCAGHGVIQNSSKQTPKELAENQAKNKSKKPSVLAKLRQYQEASAADARHRSAERDLL